MMKQVLKFLSPFAMLSTCLLGAQIDLQNPADGSASITMSPGVNADVNLVIIVHSVDSIPIAFVNAFLDTDNDLAEVTAVSGGLNWTYDRTDFTLPAALDQVGENEYGLVSGDSDGGDALPLGSATHILDVLTLNTRSYSGSTQITFETGTRQPQVFGPAPDYIPYYFPNPWGCEGYFDHCIVMGDPSSHNTPFEINYIPEPCVLMLVGLGVLGISRRQKLLHSS